MSERYSARINLRLKPETYEAYRDAAEELGVEMTGLMREFVENGVEAVQAMEQSVKALKAGRLVEGTELYGQLIRTAMSRGQLAAQQAQELEAQMREREAKRAEQVGAQS